MGPGFHRDAALGLGCAGAIPNGRLGLSQNGHREGRPMLVMDAITEILKREGISTLFSFPTTPIIEAAVAGGMRPVICRQERIGVHMADGCARVTNGNPPGVFAMQYGPGAENAFAGIASAYSDSTPVLLLPLGHPRETAQMFPLFNSTRTYASVTKHVEPVLLPEHTVPAMRRAFNALKNGRSGPVMVEVPADVMTAEFAGNEGDYTTGRRTSSASDARDLDKANDTAIPILGDAKLVLTQLAEAAKERIGKKKPSNGAAKQIEKLKVEWLGRWEAKRRSQERPINPYFVMSEFQRVIPSEDAIVTHDSGSPRDQLLPFYVAKKPRGYLGWGKSHQLGTGLGLAIGAKIGAPDKFCVNFMGDAAFGMTGLDFETAARCGIPITTIVLNNSTMAIETHAMALSHEKHKTRDLGGNYANLAADLGGWSERVTDPAEVGPAILRARRVNESGRAALLEFITSAETAFSHRRGAA